MASQEKTCLVTGATNGIGLAAAAVIAQHGFRVGLVGRDPQRAQDAADRIRAAAPAAKLDIFRADFADLAQVRRLAGDVKTQFGRLDVLLNNAGAMFTSRSTTANGFERTWGVDHLAPFVLTLSLLDLLKASAPARVVVVASRMHQNGKMNFDDLQGERKYSALGAYAQAKLANVMFAYALARRLEGSGVVCNALHPGVVATGFAMNDAGWTRTLFRLVRPFLLTPEKGARTSIHLATAPEAGMINGNYFVNSRAVASSAASNDVAAQERLWEVSRQEVEAFL